MPTPMPPPPPNRRRTNQAGKEIVEERLFFYDHPSDQDVHAAIALILGHLNKKIIRTNATKHGNTEIQLKDDK